MKKLKTFDETFSVENHDRKDGRRKKVNSKQMCVSSQKHRMRKEEGATVAASHLPSLSGPLRWAVQGSKQRNPNHRERLINYQKCPNYETPTFRHLIELQIRTNTKMQNESEKAD